MIAAASARKSLRPVKRPGDGSESPLQLRVCASSIKAVHQIKVDRRGIFILIFDYFVLLSLSNGIRRGPCDSAARGDPQASAVGSQTGST